MRILIVRLGSMGDVIHALPAVAALRQSVPDAHIGWAIERRWTPLLVADETPLSGPRTPQRPLVDTVHVVNTLAWRRALFSDETWAEVRNAIRGIRAEKYDVALDFQGSIKSATVARLSGAPARIGFAQPREKQATMLYTAKVQTAAAHVIDQNFALASLLVRRFSNQQSNTEHQQSWSRRFASFADFFPSDTAADSEVERKLAEITSHCAARSASRFAVLTPGAGWGAKQWPPQRYAELAGALAGAGIDSLINYGPGEESLAREVQADSDGTARPIFCNLSELISLTRRTSLFIGGDTGPMHLANALGVSTVALFGPTDPARTGPYTAPGWGRSIVLRHPSSRTDMRHRLDPDPGLLQISAAEVISAARSILDSPGTQHRTPGTVSSCIPRSANRDPETSR